MDRPDIEWIPAATAFGIDDITYFAGRGERDLDDVLENVDLIITGPHASAAFPEEMAPFVDDRLTRRLQFDFTDVSTSPVARRWAERDPHVLYIENPHPRAVRDANRPRPDDLMKGLREAFERLDAAGAGARPSLAGVDAVRPVTFGYLPVIRQPQTEAEWNHLADALSTAGALGVDRYEQVRDELIETGDRGQAATTRNARSGEHHRRGMELATTLDSLSIHDTMNHTARPDGAICVEREPATGCRTSSPCRTSATPSASSGAASRCCARRSPSRRSTRPTSAASAQAYRIAFDAHGSNDVAYNRPYLGGHETQIIGADPAEPRTARRGATRSGAAPTTAPRCLAERVPARVPARTRFRCRLDHAWNWVDRAACGTSQLAGRPLAARPRPRPPLGNEARQPRRDQLIQPPRTPSIAADGL